MTAHSLNLVQEFDTWLYIYKDTCYCQNSMLSVLISPVQEPHGVYNDIFEFFLCQIENKDIYVMLLSHSVVCHCICHEQFFSCSYIHIFLFMVIGSCIVFYLFYFQVNLRYPLFLSSEKRTLNLTSCWR